MDGDAIIVTGNPADGFIFIGPFEDRPACIAFADDAQYVGLDGDWWVVNLTTPSSFDISGRHVVVGEDLVKGDE